MWLLAVSIAAATLLAVLPNVRGVLCYACKWSEPTNDGGNPTTANPPPSEIPEMSEEGSRQLTEDPTCRTSQPSSTGNCDTGCSWSVWTDKGSKNYYRGCKFKNKPDGCEPYSDGRDVCFCSTSLCNNGDGTGGVPPPPPPPRPNYGCRMSENQAAISLGVLAVLFKLKIIQNGKI